MVDYLPTNCRPEALVSILELLLKKKHRNKTKPNVYQLYKCWD